MNEPPPLPLEAPPAAAAAAAGAAGAASGGRSGAAPRWHEPPPSGIRHAYGEREVLRGIDLEVAPGEILCLLGPSGDGKTTLLRLVAGLEPLQAGRIELDGAVLAEPGRELPPEERRVGFVFQDYALFPHLTVAENVAFGLRRVPRGERGWQVAEALARVGLEAYANAWPHMLSGGQQQRVALARALAPRPRCCCWTRPSPASTPACANRCATTRCTSCSSGIPALIVTHDAEEAMFMADRIALMRAGRVVQLGTPEAAVPAPRRALRRHLPRRGEPPARPGPRRPGRDRHRRRPRPRSARRPGRGAAAPRGAAPDPPGRGGTPAEVEACRLLGATTLVHLAVADGEGGLLHLHARLPPGAVLARGQQVGVAMDPERAFVFPPSRPDEPTAPGCSSASC